MRLHFTSGYHPEGDRQTERANQVLEQYLWGYTNYQQDDWVTLLPMAEFTYNNAMNTTTGVSPFFANKGYHLEITLDPQAETSSAEADIHGRSGTCPGRVEGEHHTGSGEESEEHRQTQGAGTRTDYHQPSL